MVARRKRKEQPGILLNEHGHPIMAGVDMSLSEHPAEFWETLGAGIQQGTRKPLPLGARGGSTVWSRCSPSSTLTWNPSPMPTLDVEAQCWRDYRHLTPNQRDLLNGPLVKFGEDLPSGRLRTGLRVKGVKEQPANTR